MARSQHPCASGPCGDVALEEGGELIRSRGQLSAAVTDEVEVEASHGIDQLAHHHLAVAAGGQPKRRNNGDAFFCFDQGNLRVEQAARATE